ncbi:MAG: PAS domain S-box protein [Nitrospirae bacterium]|nr:PAS domain S-box protein [Nitrospirota bacterium]
MSIRLKLTITFLLFVLVPSLFGSVLTFTNYKKSLETVRLANVRDIAAFKADKIETYFAGLKANLELSQGYYNIRKNLPVMIRLAKAPDNPEFVLSRKILDAQLQHMQSVLSLSDIMLANPMGEIVYSSNPEHKLKDFLGMLHDPQQKAFAEGKNKVYFSDIFLDKAQGNKPSMLVSGPAFDLDGVFIGVIAFEVDMNSIYELIQDITGLGNTGEVLLGKRIGNEVVYLNPLRHDPAATLKRTISIGGELGVPIQEAVQGRKGAGRLIDYSGREVIAAWRYMPFLDWGMVAKIDTEEAFADVTNLRRMVIVVLSFIFLLCGTIAFSIARSISAPIKTLSRGAEIVGSGNLDHKVGTGLKDEIGQLSRAFDRMTGDLKKITASRDELNSEIAERKRAEQLLLESEGRLKRAQEIAHLGGWELDLVNNNLTWSDEVYRIFGLQPQEFAATYEAFLDAVHPDDRAAVDEAYSGSLREGKDSYEVEHRVIRKYSGEIRYVHEKCGHVRDGSGRVVRSAGMVHDITERKLAEAAVIRAKEEWERTFNSVPDLIAILDTKHRIVRVNKAMAEKLGLNAEQCIGLPCYKYVHGLSEPPDFCPHKHTMKDCRQHVREVNEPRLGGDFLVSTTPLLNEKGEMTGSVHVARDISERKRAEEAIKKLNEDLRHHVLQLEAANRELEAFSYSVSHDLRSPLRSVAGFSRALFEDYADKLNSEGRDFLERILAATQKMGQLIDDLLNLSRVSRSEMRREEVNLSGLAGNIADMLRKTHPERQAEFIITEGLAARGDEHLLTIVLENLLGNAWKFTGKNQRAVIEFGVYHPFHPPASPLNKGGIKEGSGGEQGVAGKDVYFVKDNGAGFDMSYAGKIFSPFQRLHSVSEFPGTGIGLATVKRIINRHGGNVWIEAEAGKGTTVYFTV